jgi:putative transposase
MARTPRSIQVQPGQPHHIVLRGNNRRRLFSYDNDCRLLLGYMRQSQQEQRVAVHALALLPNHIHVLVTPVSQSSLSGWVKTFAQRYAAHRNQRLGATGKLFEQRFYSKPVVEDTHLSYVTPYIDWNAPKDGHPAFGRWHRWSTYGLHAGCASRFCIPPALWTPSPWYLTLGSDNASRAAEYSQWLHEYCANRKGTHGLPEFDTTPPHTASGERPRRPDGSPAT